MGRVLIVITGVLVAAAAGLAGLIGATLVELSGLHARDSLVALDGLAWTGAMLGSEKAGTILWAAAHFAWVAVLAICFAPVAAAAAIGEAIRLRAWVWYAAATGAGAAAVPVLLVAVAGGSLQVQADAGSLEGHVALIAFLVGVLAGSVYWAVAGRGVGERRRLLPPGQS